MRLLFAVLLFVVSSAQATSEVMYIGGGGEQARTVNAFDGSIDSIQDVTQRRSLPVSYVVDLDHPSTRRKFSLGFHRPYFQLTKSQVEKSLSQLAERIQTPQFKNGESALIFVDTHGLEGDDGKVTIATSDGEFDVAPHLKKVIEAASAKGVKLGIVLGNCYSGALLKLDPTGKTCIVSNSTSGRLGYTNFGSQVVLEIAKGRDMEAAFLAARKKYLTEAQNSGLFGVPQISTEAGLSTMETLSVFSRYRYDYRDIFRVLREKVACEDELAQIDKLQALAAAAMDKTEFVTIEKTLARFRQGVKLYGLTKKEIERRKEIAPYLNREARDWCVSQAPATPDELKRWNFPDQNQYCDALLKVPSCDLAVFSRESFCDNPQVSGVIKDKMFQGRARFLAKVLADAHRELVDNVLPVQFDDWAISNSEERALYDSIYRMHTSALKDTSNACRDFKL